MSETFEEWRKIKDFPDYYVSSLGRVKSTKKGGSLIKTLTPDKGGYLMTGLYANKKSTTKKVHRLVAEAFLTNDGYDQINHKDGDKTNNSISNLEWCSSYQNSMHRELMKNEIKGVYFDKVVSKWYVQVRVNNDVTNHGYYKTKEEAISVYYKKFKEIAGYHPFESEIVSNQQKAIDELNHLLEKQVKIIDELGEMLKECNHFTESIAGVQKAEIESLEEQNKILIDALREEASGTDNHLAMFASGLLKKIKGMRDD